MEIKLAVLADAANVSQQGKLNITGIFNRINARQLPATWPMMNLVIRVEAHRSEAGTDHTVEVRIVDADGQQIGLIEGGFRVEPAQHPAHPIRGDFIVPITGATFPHAGTYSFDILIDGRYEDSLQLFLEERSE